MPRKKAAPATEATLVPKSETTVPPVPVPPSPAVLKLQEQVVSLVEQRSQARELLSVQHSVYLSAQAQFQAAEAALKEVEQDIQYRISLIAQLENRTPSAPSTPQSVLQMPSMEGVSSSPAPLQVGSVHAAVGDAGDLRRAMGMM